MEHQVYQVLKDLVNIYMIDIDKFLFFILFFYRWSTRFTRSWRYVFIYKIESVSIDCFFIGEKGEPGLPGPGFPGKKIILCYPTNI
jgi:hypothetical protein